MQQIIEEFNGSSESNFIVWFEHEKERLLQAEKDIIVNAVNATDYKCVSHANVAIRHLTKDTGNLFDHTGQEGKTYYTENFVQWRSLK